MSATFREVDETVERDLFDRRARAMDTRMDTPSGVPSLEDVLRAAGEEASVAVPARAARDEETSVARRHAWSGLALAAACVLAVMKALPQAGAPPAIAADVGVDAGASIAIATNSDTCEEAEVNSCTVDLTRAAPPIAHVALAAPASVAPVSVAPISAGPVTSEDHACAASVAAPPSSETMSCDRDEANRSQMP